MRRYGNNKLSNVWDIIIYNDQNWKIVHQFELFILFYLLMKFVWHHTSLDFVHTRRACFNNNKKKELIVDQRQRDIKMAINQWGKNIAKGNPLLKNQNLYPSHAGRGHGMIDYDQKYAPWTPAAFHSMIRDVPLFRLCIFF